MSFNFGDSLLLNDGRIGAFVEDRNDFVKILIQRSDGECGLSLVEKTQCRPSIKAYDAEVSKALQDLQHLKKYPWGP